MNIIKITTLVFLCTSAGLEAASGAVLTFSAPSEGENALDETVRIKIWEGEDSPEVTDGDSKLVTKFTLKPGKSYKKSFSSKLHWAQAFGEDGNSVGDVEALKSKGFHSRQPGMFYTQDVANTDVAVVKKNNKVGFISTEAKKMYSAS
jgi:hypothetical protein